MARFAAIGAIITAVAALFTISETNIVMTSTIKINQGKAIPSVLADIKFAMFKEIPDVSSACPTGIIAASMTTTGHSIFLYKFPFKTLMEIKAMTHNKNATTMSITLNAVRPIASPKKIKLFNNLLLLGMV